MTPENADAGKWIANLGFCYECQHNKGCHYGGKKDCYLCLQQGDRCRRFLQFPERCVQLLNTRINQLLGDNDMSLQPIEAKLTGGEPVTAQYDYGDNLQEAIAKFGEEKVYSYFRADVIISIQAYMRSLLKQTDPQLTEEEIAVKVLDWKPGVKARAKSVAEKFAELWAGLTEEQKAEVLAGR